MGENGRRLVDTQFGWDDIARRTEMVYERDGAGRYVAENEEYLVEVTPDNDRVFLVEPRP